MTGTLVPSGQTTSTAPSFLVVGAMKAGTTTLMHYLEDCDRVHMLPYEPHFFSDDGLYARGIDYYESLFQGWDGRSIVGEKTATYSYHPESASRIHRHYPDIKLVWVFRNPVQRAYSNYWHSVNGGSERLSFDRAIALEERRLQRDIYRGYAARGRYAEQVERFLQFFSAEQMQFILFEKFVTEPAEHLERLARFLGLPHDSFAEIRPKKSHVTAAPRSLYLQWLSKRLLGKTAPYRFIRRLNRRSTRAYPSMNPATRQKLVDYFQPYNQQLNQLTGLDVDIWNQ